MTKTLPVEVRGLLFDDGLVSMMQNLCLMIWWNAIKFIFMYSLSTSWQYQLHKLSLLCTPQINSVWDLSELASFVKPIQPSVEVGENKNAQNEISCHYAISEACHTRFVTQKSLIIDIAWNWDLPHLEDRGQQGHRYAEDTEKRVQDKKRSKSWNFEQQNFQLEGKLRGANLKFSLDWIRKTGIDSTPYALLLKFPSSPHVNHHS